MTLPPDVSSVLEIFRAPRIPYSGGLEIQEAWVHRRRRGEIPDRLLLLEHPHVVTQGRGSDPANLLRTPGELAAMGVELFEAGRGGDVTYHGPGQLVGYPVLDLKPGAGRPDRRDLHRYLRDLEGVLIDTLADWGIEGTRTAGMTGVWTEAGKVAAIGVRVSSGWITSHGFALNITTDLAQFASIVPCGLRGRDVTSLARLLPAPPDRRDVEERIVHHFARRFAPEGGWEVREAGGAGGPGQDGGANSMKSM
ncbi:MAG: lipoyl(octanoyl) transferase LipB [Gemmatimonadales bacterium]|nr:MAG: lipoyl(octanoyl) transferase LipB [Gemmatimonadales bacterium]